MISRGSKDRGTEWGCGEERTSGKWCNGTLFKEKYELFKSDIGESYHETSMCGFNICSSQVRRQSTLYSYS